MAEDSGIEGETEEGNEEVGVETPTDPTVPEEPQDEGSGEIIIGDEVGPVETPIDNSPAQPEDPPKAPGEDGPVLPQP